MFHYLSHNYTKDSKKNFRHILWVHIIWQKRGETFVRPLDLGCSLLLGNAKACRYGDVYSLVKRL